MVPGEGGLAGRPQGPAPLPRRIKRACRPVSTTQRAPATVESSAGTLAAGGVQPSYPHNMSKAERQAETQRRIAEAKARMAAAQQRLGRAATDAGRAAASAAAAANSSAAALDKATAALDPTQTSAPRNATAAALALACQEAEKSNQAVAAVAAAVAGEAERQQALLEHMRSQLASLQQCVPQQPAAHRLMRSADHEAPSAAVTKPPSAAEAACTGAGAELSVAIASGAGRQLLAATGRVVAAAAVATAVNEQVRLAQATGEAAPAAATQHGQQNAFDLLRRYEAQAQQAQQGGKPRWSIVNLLLAPVVPLLRGLPTPSSRGKRETAAGEEEAGTMRNGYDMLLDLLSSLTASVQGDARYEPLRELLAAAPASGQPRYDFARSLLRGVAAADGDEADSLFDMARGLLQRQQASEGLAATGGSQYDPVWALLKEAALLEEWGPPAGSKYDPLEGFSGWAAALPASPRSRYCPWGDLVAAVMAWKQSHGRIASKYDPWTFVSAAARDPTWLGPTGASRYCPVSAALDSAAGWEAPSGCQRYDPVGAARQAAAGWEDQPSVSSADDPLAWLFDSLLDGWGADRRGPSGAADDSGAVYSYA